ncbi:hypothetical protein LCGC14_0946760 [marine sediment metagenome]|uniref:Band 7 domain-containing protein n=1 Tax=marine sediment metagenome TaxID=412755 RepID=A0A0F9R231_9ZZZZ
MDFLTKIYESIKKLIPRLELIQPDEAGVRITLGTREKILKPGWYLLWPIIQELLYTTVTTQVKDLRSQSIISKDCHDMTVSGAVKYKITDIRKAMLEVQDFDGSLDALSLGVLLAVASTMTREELQDTEGLGDNILKKIREEASGWGLRLQKFYITDLGRTRNVRLLTNNNGVMVQ